jgi:hypothetical protein
VKARACAWASKARPRYFAISAVTSATVRRSHSVSFLALGWLGAGELVHGAENAFPDRAPVPISGLEQLIGSASASIAASAPWRFIRMLAARRISRSSIMRGTVSPHYHVCKNRGCWLGRPARTATGLKGSPCCCGAVYKNKPQEETYTEERAPRAAVLKRFDDTVKMAGMHHGCAVIGMWLIDEATEQGDVVRIYGAVPIEIRTRHEAYLARTTATN